MNKPVEETFKSITKNKEKLKSLFKYHKKLDNAPVLIARLPEVILNEMKSFVENGNKIRNHELGFLREHHNAGENAYQISVPISDVNNSFTWPYLVVLGQYYLYEYKKLTFRKTFKEVSLRRTEHADGYDLWLNYTKKGSINPPHVHEGYLSGVIYLKNTESSPTFFITKEGKQIQYNGSVGEIIIFPSSLEHFVEEYLGEEERITSSFNLMWNEIDYYKGG